MGKFKSSLTPARKRSCGDVSVTVGRRKVSGGKPEGQNFNLARKVSFEELSEDS
jgi:hypothetical protein